MIDRAKKLLAILDGSEKAELTLLVNAVVSTMKSYQDQSTAIRKRDWDVAREALEEVVEKFEARASSETKDTLDSIPAAHAWLQEEGYEITERSVRNHVQLGNLPAERSRNGKVKSIRLIDLKRYAKNHLQQADGSDQSDNRARLIKEQADKLELENDIKRGKYLDRAEEEQRDAAVLAAFRRHIEGSAPDRIQGFIAEIGKVIGDEARPMLVARQPEWLQQDMDFLSRMFDGFRGA